MNCPSRTDEPEGTGMNQNPNALAADLTTREDLNGIANSRLLLRNTSQIKRTATDEPEPADAIGDKKGPVVRNGGAASQIPSLVGSGGRGGGGGGSWPRVTKVGSDARKVVMKFGHFVGPGMMVSCISNF